MLEYPLSQLKLSIGHKEGKGYKTLMGISNFTIDVCKHFDGKLESAFLDIFMSDFKKYSNVFYPCPHKVRIIRMGAEGNLFNIIIIYCCFQGHLYIRNYVVSDILYPPIDMSGDYYVRLLFFNRKRGIDQIMTNVMFFVKIKSTL